MPSIQLCYDCAFKHISDASTIWNEIENGYGVPDHYMKFVGALSQAADHLLEKHPELSFAIREARKEWFDSRVLGGKFRPPFEDWAMQVWELITVNAAEISIKGTEDGKEIGEPSA